MLKRTLGLRTGDKQYFRTYRRNSRHPDGLPEYRTMSRAWINRDTERWWLLDCRGQQLGHVAKIAANFITAQHRADFRPGILNGDQVVAINCKDVVMTGDQWIRNPIEWHTRWAGGRYRVRMSDMFNKDPCMVVWAAVKHEINFHFRKKEAMRVAPMENLWLYETAVHPHGDRGLRPLSWNPSPVNVRYKGKDEKRWSPNEFMQ